MYTYTYLQSTYSWLRHCPTGALESEPCPVGVCYRLLLVQHCISTGDSPEIYLAKETDIAARQRRRELSFLPMQIPELWLRLVACEQKISIEKIFHGFHAGWRSLCWKFNQLSDLRQFAYFWLASFVSLRHSCSLGQPVKCWFATK